LQLVPVALRDDGTEATGIVAVLRALNEGAPSGAHKLRLLRVTDEPGNGRLHQNWMQVPLAPAPTALSIPCLLDSLAKLCPADAASDIPLPHGWIDRDKLDVVPELVDRVEEFLYQGET
jgi:hypothetical protein